MNQSRSPKEFKECLIQSRSPDIKQDRLTRKIQEDQIAMQVVSALNFWQIRRKITMKVEAILLKLGYQIKDWCNCCRHYFVQCSSFFWVGHSLAIRFQFLIILLSWIGSLAVISFLKGLISRESSLHLRNTHNFSCK